MHLLASKAAGICRKKLPCLLIGAALIAGFNGGCSTAAETQKNRAEQAPDKNSIGVISAMEAMSASAFGRDLGDKLLAALQKNDFAAVQSLPLGVGHSEFSKEKFEQLCKKLRSQNGIAKFAYLTDLKLGRYRRLLWKVELNAASAENSADVIFELIVAKVQNRYRVAGFGFRP
ncbi:MAG: hypothetical protein E7052_04960 [Lentisphaerae bacterium]|nr:hypothetical protein [Lentisphaerota bacterium]